MLISMHTDAVRTSSFSWSLASRNVLRTLFRNIGTVAQIKIFRIRTDPWYLFPSTRRVPKSASSIVSKIMNNAAA